MGNLNVRKPFPMELHLKAKSIELKSETFNLSHFEPIMAC